MSSSLASVRNTPTGALLNGSRRLEELGAGAGFDLVDQQTENTVEQIDVLVVILIGAVEKERRDALQRLDALLPSAMRDDRFKFGQQGEIGTHRELITFDKPCGARFLTIKRKF